MTQKVRSPEMVRALAALPVVLAFLVIGSVLAVGTVHFVPMMILGVVAIASGAIAWDRAGRAARMAAMVFGALAIYSLLQSLPLPAGLMRHIAGANTDIWSRAFSPFGESGPSWVSLSLDPGASRLEALRWLSYAGVLLTAAAVAAEKGGTWVVALIFVSAITAALVTVAHGLLGATMVWGLYQPTFPVAEWHVGPLLNPNNLAGYLNLGVLAGIGLLVARSVSVPRWVIGCGIAVVVAVELVAASRGAALALPIGIIAFALVIRATRRTSTRVGNRPFWLMGGAVAFGGALALLGGKTAIWNELYDKNVEKLDVFKWSLPMLRDHAWVGVGRGAFESVFPAYQLAVGNRVFTHVENFPLQWAIEWGVVVSAAALGALAWMFRPGAMGVRKGAVQAAAWIGAAVLLLQNLVDLALEVPGVCVALAAVLGALTINARAHSRADDAGSPRPRLAFMAAGAVALALTGAFGDHDVATDRADLREAYAHVDFASPGSRADMRHLLRDAMARHPAEPYFPLLGAALAVRARDQSPMPWVQRSLERARISARSHLLLAETLAHGHLDSQARFELRMAAEQDPDLADTAAELAMKVGSTVDDLLETVPADGRAGVGMLDSLSLRLTNAGKTAESERFDEEAMRRDPADVPSRDRTARRLIDRSTKHEAPCADPEPCLRRVAEMAASLADAHPELSTAAQLRALVLAARGHPEQGDDLLAQACVDAEDRIPCLQARTEIAATIKDPARLEAASRELLAHACMMRKSCALFCAWVGRLRLNRSEAGTALSLYARAAREDPTEPRLLELANVAHTAGAHVQAAEALEAVAAKHGGATGELKARIAEEKSLAARNLIQP